MPTTTRSRFASMTASQVLAEQASMLVRYAAEDAERRARHAKILSAL